MDLISHAVQVNIVQDKWILNAHQVNDVQDNMMNLVPELFVVSIDLTFDNS